MLSTKASCALEELDWDIPSSEAISVTCTDHFRLPFTTSRQSVLAVARPSENGNIEAPIMPSSHFATFRKQHKFGTGARECGLHRTSPGTSLFELEQRPKTLKFSDSDTDLFLTSYRVLPDEQCTRIKFMTKDNFKELLKQREITALEETSFSRDKPFISEEFQMPIVRLGVLGAKGTQVKKLIEHPIWPSGRTIPVFMSHLDDISQYVRHRYTYEMGYWCVGSKEILNKSRYFRSQLLRRIPPLSVKKIAESSAAPIPRDLVAPGSSSSVERIEDAVAVLQGAVREKPFPPKRWKKFVRAVREDVDDEIHALEKLRVRRIRDGIGSYDPPKKRRSPACGEVIQTMYSCTQKIRSHNSPTGHILHPSRDGSGDEVHSDESFLDDLILSDDDVLQDRNGATALGALIGFGEASGDQKHAQKTNKPNHPPTNENAVVRTNDDRSLPQDRDDDEARRVRNLNYQPKDSEVRLQAPENMVCSSSSLQIAEYCLQHLKRGVVFVPPPLSLLPTLAAVANSFLSATLCDHRVVIICEPNTDTVARVASYLEFTCGGSVSIDTVRRMDCDQLPRLASLAQKTARIVILDSFAFKVPPAFALLIVLGPDAPLWNSTSPGMSASGTDWSTSVSNWKTIASILVLPYHPRDTLIAYSQKAKRLASMLNLNQVLFVEERDDIHHLTLLSRPDYLYLVPPREVLDLIASLETHASSFFSTYQRILDHENCTVLKGNVGRLQEVEVAVLEKLLSEETPRQHGTNSTDDLEVLYCLRQARSFALYDGYDTAIEYIEHYSLQASSKAMAVVQSILEEVHDPSRCADKTILRSHPMTVALEKTFKKMEQDMLNHAPSLQSIHRRSHCRPLVITNSKEAYDGLMKSLANAKDVLEAGDGDVSLCELRHLSSGKGKKESTYEYQVYEAATKFSHVYHILDDRNRRSRNDLLPSHLLQYIHAGRTRLLTIAVDETRTLDSTHKRNEDLYRDLTALLDAADTAGQPKSYAFMKTVRLQEVISSLNSLVCPFERVVETHPATGSDGQPGPITARCEPDVTHGRAPKQRPAAKNEIHISVTEICQSSAAGLRSMFKAKLESIRCQSNQGILHVFVKVGAREKCTPATTYIFAALACDPDLHKHTKVTTVLQY